MDNYHVTSKLGAGTYGKVHRAIHRTTKEVVAIKRLQQEYQSHDECMQLREVQSLLRLNDHPNIIKVKHFIFENKKFFFVFEHMDNSLSQLIRNKDKLVSEAEVRNWMFQILKGVDYMHRGKYFHRDLKPDNLLVSNDVIKVADLGMATEMVPGRPYTGGVCTLCYWAPEVLLQSSDCGARYDAPIDIWAMGAIMAELFALRLLFPGASELGQLHQICTLLGAPTERTWPGRMKMAASLHFKFPQLSPTNPLSRLQNASPEAIDLISAMCSWNPRRRPTASQALQHPFFTQVHKQHVPLPSCKQSFGQFNLQPTRRATRGVKLGSHYSNPILV